MLENNLGINLSAYQNGPVDRVLSDQSNVSESALNDLSKALAAQDITGRTTDSRDDASGAPLKVESLDSTLKMITFGENEIVLWKKIPKLPAYNTVEEYNQLISYGQDRGGFITEGELPVEEDSTYMRRSQLVKFMGVTKSVTHPMTLVNTMIGDAIAREAKNGTLWILRKLNKSLTTGNSAIVPEEFNGLYAQHNDPTVYATPQSYFDSDVVVDLRGGTLEEKYIERAAEGIIENFGMGNELFAPPKVLSDFVTSFYGSKYINPNSAQVTDGVMGQKVNEFQSQFGRIGLNWDIFMNHRPARLLSSGANSTSAPLAPTVGATPQAVVSGVDNSKWGATDAANYIYAVSAVNRYGESAMTAMSAATPISVTSGSAVDLQFTATAGANTTTGFIVYRSNPGATTAALAKFYPVFEISTAQLAQGYDGGAATKVRDMNRLMPNTNQAFLIQNNAEVHAFRQLAPLMKMDLALISTAFRFMVLLYGTPLLFAPKKMVRFINIGKLAS